MKSEKLNIEVSLSSEHSCYVSVKDYTIYVEVSKATNDKPYISFDTTHASNILIF